MLGIKAKKHLSDTLHSHAYGTTSQQKLNIAQGGSASISKRIKRGHRVLFSLVELSTADVQYVEGCALAGCCLTACRIEGRG